MAIVINEHTKVMARFHPSVNNRGLNIYNPYFQDTGVNAVYLLFPNPDPKVLFDGMKLLNISGAIVAGSFEGDNRIPAMVDDLHPLSKIVQRVGMVVNKEGHIWGVYQGAFGLDEAIRRLTDYSDKKVIILGAGTVVRGLLGLMQINGTKPVEVEIYNRSVQNVERIAHEFPFISKVGPMKEMTEKSQGNIFINATPIGSPWNRGEDFIFPDEFISRFDYIVDVTFVPLNPQLIQSAERLNKKVSPGHRMFLFQGKYALEKILGINVNEDKLSNRMIEDFRENWS